MTDREEYLVGTHPNDAGSFLKFTSIETRDEFVEMHFMAAAYRRYSLYWSAQPDSGNWRHFADVLPSSEDRLVTVTNNLVQSVPRYYRIQGLGIN